MSSRTLTVKNRAPAPIQITAEQLLREAKERQLEQAPKAPKQFITDKEELLLYQQGKRKDFEDQIRRQRHHIGTWTKYGLWEASQMEFERARSVFERALDIDYRNQTIWFKYAEMEMKNKFVNHARNVLDRAVALHPRVDPFWLKYTYMEEMIGAIDQTRQIFERWMKWEPDDNGWASYIKFEMRQGEIGRARGIYERYISCHPTSRAYLKYARWEEKQQQRALARLIYERSLSEIHDTERSENLIVNFARFEERCHEYERARTIYRYAIDRIEEADEKDKEGVIAIADLKQEFAAFEKRHGSRKDIEDAIVQKRRTQYESQVGSDPYNYDFWFDYCKLEETEGTVDTAREVYERAIANIPIVQEKRYWRRYIYLWIYYAVFEELQGKDPERARAVYKACIGVIPHKKFSFGKIWLMAAQFEVRQRDLAAARKLLGNGIGLCEKENIFKGYIDLELQLGEIERCRSIYVKYLEVMPHNCSAWRAFAQLEINVGESARARAIFELAISQPAIDMPEVLWKAYIDFEISESEGDNVRALYGRLLEKTTHVKVWISFAQFEASPLLGKGILKARELFESGYENLKKQGLKEERVLLLEAWREAEVAASEPSQSDPDRGTGDVSLVENKLPRKIKMRRMATAEDGSDLGVWEEYYDYTFPDDEKKIVGMKLLENAMKWKQALAGAKAGGGGKAIGGDDSTGEAESSIHKRKASELSEVNSEEIQIDED